MSDTLILRGIEHYVMYALLLFFFSKLVRIVTSISSFRKFFLNLMDKLRRIVRPKKSRKVMLKICKLLTLCHYYTLQINKKKN